MGDFIGPAFPPLLAGSTALESALIAQQQLGQAQAQMNAIVRQAFLGPQMYGSAVYLGDLSIVNIQEPPEPSYETPGWLKDMHTTIDTLHARGI